MADGRILHRSAGDSAKVAALGDLEYRVWTQYLLSADDRGVMPAEAVKVQADNRALRTRPRAKVQGAIETLVRVGLVAVFTHQGQRYLYQPDWHEWQSIRYPRQSVYPPPPQDCGEVAETLPKDCGEVAEISPHPARAGGRETLTLTLTQTQTRSGSANPHSQPTNLVNGAELRQHAQHAWCSWPERDGLCVPAFLHREFVGKLGGADAEARLRAWYPGVVAAFAGQPVGDDALVFWRNSFARWVGVVTSAPAATKGQRTMDAARRVIRERGGA